MKIVNMRDIIQVTHSGSYPLNLRFKLNMKTSEILNGPGIYLIALNDQPIYVGKHQPIQRIVFDRWLKSFETLTFRGSRLGFGNRNKQAVLEDINAQSPLLFSALQSMPESELSKHFRDTGVNTSRNGTLWVSSKWDEHFREHSDIRVAKSLSFAFIRFTNVTNQADGNRLASALESFMFDTYHFEINFQAGGVTRLHSLDEAIAAALEHSQQHWPEAQAEATLKLIY